MRTALFSLAALACCASAAAHPTSATIDSKTAWTAGRHASAGTWEKSFWPTTGLGANVFSFTRRWQPLTDDRFAQTRHEVPRTRGLPADRSGRRA